MAQQILNGKGVAAIMNSRLLITSAVIGRTVLLAIQGNGNTVEVKNKDGENVASYAGDGSIFEKKIFNGKANSEVAMRNPLNKQLLKDAIAAEKAGDADGAAEIYNKYLNKVQLSFNVPLPSALADRLGDRDDIAAKVMEIKTENGTLLTIDPKTIKVMEPTVLSTTKFTLEVGDDEDEDLDLDETPTQDEFAGMDRKALVTAAKEINFATKGKTDDEVRAALRAAKVAAEEEA
jgi:hypothetical protein